MKYTLSLLTLLTMYGCGWGQYPQLRVDSKGKVFRVTPIYRDTIPIPTIGVVIDSIKIDTTYEPSTLFLISPLDSGLSFIEFYAGNSDSPFVELSINKKDTVITVVGDSLNAIKSLFNVWADKQKEIKELKHIIELYKQGFDEMAKPNTFYYLETPEKKSF